MGKINEKKTPSNSPIMGRIERMVEEMCPEGIKSFSLKEIFDMKNGYTPSTSNESFWVGGTLPWFKMEDIRTNGKILSDSIIHITPSALKGKGLFKANSIILATSATIGEHALITVDFLCNQRFTCLTPKKDFIEKVNIRFINYYMDLVDEWCKSHINQGGFASVDMDKLREFPIPLPPLPIQEAIADILDKFDRLSAELQAELQARKQQYEYYRNQLLTRFAPDQPVTEYSLGELCTSISSGKCKSKNFEGRYAVYGSTGIIAMTDTPMYNCEQILVARVGANAGAVQIASGEYDVTDNALIVKLKDAINRKYIFYLLQNQNLNQYAVGGGQPLITGTFLKDLTILLPSLSEQARIVSILDKFEALVNDLSQGLPAEIAAVKEQYEYYRNKLLTFKAKE